MIREFTIFLMLAGSGTAQSVAVPMVENFQPQSGDPEYQRGISALDAHNWDQAIEYFDTVAERHKPGADAALYWKAYAESHAGEAEDALSTVADLRHRYPASRWLKDAQAIEVEVRTQGGEDVNLNAQPDQDLKLIALNSLMSSDAATAVPVLQKFLASNNSLALKERALFILSQSGSPEARKIVAGVAQNSQNRDLQLHAIRFMGMMGNEQSRKEMASLYAASSDEAVKREILKGYMLSGSRSQLEQAARSEKNPELRREAIRNLALAGGQTELAGLYSSALSPEDKKDILRSMFLTGNSEKLLEVARTEKDPGLRSEAIRSLGLMGRNGQADELVNIYRSDTHAEVREAVLKALFLQQNGKALVDLARAEKDPAMKAKIVKNMALVHTKETTDYMMEVLK